MYTFHAVNECDCYFTSTKGSLPEKIKKTKDEVKMGDTLQVLRICTSQKQDNLFESFGKLAANKVRSLDNKNIQSLVKFKIQEIIFQAQCNPQVQKQMKNSVMASLTTPQKVCCPAFPHSIKSFGNNISLREAHICESRQSPRASNLEITE